MNRLDNSGRYLLSGLSREVSLLKRGDDSPRILSARGTYAQWFDAYARVAIWQDLTGEAPAVVTMGVSDEKPTVIEPQGCTGLAANAGRFTAFRTGVGLFGHIPPGVIAARAALAPDWSINGRAPMGRDGTLAFVAEYQSTGPLLLHAKGAAETVLAAAQSPYGLQVLGPAAATWNGGAFGVDVSGRFPGAAWGIPLEMPDGLWWADFIEGRGFCVYKSGARIGFLVAVDAWAPDAVVAPDGIVVGYSTGAGELPHEARIVTMPELQIVRLDLPIALPPPPPPVETPPIGNEQPPIPPDPKPTGPKPPTGEPMPPTLKVPPPSIDQWIKHEYPQVRDAYIKKQGHEPGDEWGAFQTKRRYDYWVGNVDNGKWTFGDWWPVERMVAHELGEDDSPARFPQP